MHHPVKGFFRRSNRLLRSTVLIITSALIVNSAWAERVVTMASDPWPPFVEGNLGESAHSGIATVIHQEIFSRIEDVEVSIPLIPWKRVLREVEQGSYDGIPMLLKTPEREAYLAYSEPFMVGRNLLWSVADAQGQAFEWDSIDDLRGKRIGIVMDYSYGEQFDTLFREGTLDSVQARNADNLFKLLANGRVELVLASEAVGFLYAGQIKDARILPAAKPTDTDIYHIGISRKSWAVELLPEINRVIAELSAEGFIDRVLRGEQP